MASLYTLQYYGTFQANFSHSQHYGMIQQADHLFHYSELSLYICVLLEAFPSYYGQTAGV